MAQRGCTDILCLLVFVACLGGLFGTFIYARENGDINNISRGYNYDQKLCGMGELVDQPYLFYCLEPPLGQSFDVKRPVCIKECPTDNENMVENCPDGPWVGYPSRAVAGRTCMPTDASLLEKVNDGVKSGTLSQLPLKIAQLPEAWVPLLLSALIAFIVGFVYLHVLDWFARPIVWGCLLTVIAIPLIIGGYLVWVSTGHTGNAMIPESGLSKEQDLYVGCGLGALSLVFLLCTCCSHSGIDKAIECVQMACEAMFAQNSMLLAPAIEVISKIVLIVPLLVGLMMMASCGEIEFPEGTGYGVYRTFVYTPEQWGMLGFIVFMIFWLMELVTSVSQFVVAYAVQAWYFTPIDPKTKVKVGAPHLGIFTGYALASTVHCGSLALGSCLIAYLRFFRMLLGLLFDKKDTSNPIAEIIGSILCCFADCFERFLKLLNKSAYIEVAINGTGFCASATEALHIVENQVTAVAALHGATFILQFAGIGAIAAGGAALTWLMCINVPTFSDASSEHHVEDPIFITGVASILCGVIGVAFMNVFDTAADTMLFCFATEKKIGDLEDAKTPLVVDEATSALAFLGCGRKAFPPQEKAAYSSGKLKELIATHR